MTQTYELMMAVSISKPLDEKIVKEQIKKQSGDNVTISTVVDFGRRVLAYPIRKQKEGQYWLVTFTAAATGISTLSKKLQQDEHVLRFLVVKKYE